MAYLTQALLKARVGGQEIYVQLTDDDRDQKPDPNVETLLLGQVDSFMEGYARRGGYTVPLVATDAALLIPAMLDVSNYKAKSRRGKASKEDLENYKDAIALFNDLASGAFVLPSSSSGSTGGFANLDFDGNEQMFNRQTLRNL